MKPKPFCFVLMPFDKEFDDIYNFGIKGACTEAGAYCERVDEQIFLKERILDRIYNQIVKADVIVADMTGKNANVFYEVGYAHALGKTTILLTQSADDIPFDLKHYPHIIYANQISILKDELVKKVKWAVENPDIKPQESLAIDVFNRSSNLSNNNPPLNLRYNRSFSARLPISLTFYNNSFTTFESGDFQVGLVLPSSFKFLTTDSGEIVREVTMFRLPDNQVICMLPYFSTLFPEAYNAFSTILVFKDPEKSFDIIVRIFSKAGSRDYQLSVLAQEIEQK